MDAHKNPTANYFANSMTAFSRTQEQASFGQFSWEIRSVNQRYLEITPRLPDIFRHLETTIRNQIKQQIARGKVEISLQFEFTQTPAQIQVNQAVLTTLTAAVSKVQHSMPEATHLNPLEVLQWPGVLKEHSGQIAQDDWDKTVLDALERALALFCQHRLREGQGLAQSIIERCYKISQQIALLEPKLPQILERHCNKLKQRIADLCSEMDDNRFHQEVAIMAQKMDVHEEIDRLKIHLSEVQHILTKGQQTPDNTDSNSIAPIGRRLDFLMQELNREANTLGSKAIDTQISQTSVELKVLIEQIREQVQNIE
ncbi:MAG: YicC/YloC family endoribonuclease [Thiomicrorhabdus sp.]|nr:YicC/YloC family endoribonuclease [Thiomicrorhabdus sp.]